MSSAYDGKLNDAIQFIDSNLESPLSLEKISSEVGASKFHFLRQFSAFFGIGVYDYIKLGRLKRASYELAFRKGRRVIDVALSNGYESPEAFSRAFKQIFGRSPSSFRRSPDWLAWHVTFQALTVPRRNLMSASFVPPNVEIINFPRTSVMAFEHRGDPVGIGDSVREFIEWRKQHRLPPHKFSTYNIFYDDPGSCPPNEYKLDICVASSGPVKEEGQRIVPKVIPEGRCAKIRLVGSDTMMGAGIKHLYSHWLPNSGEELRDFPLFVQRVKFFPDVAENEAITDVFLPIR